MFDRKEHFIGGSWRTATGGDLLEVISPSTEEIVGRVPVAGPAEIDQAVASAGEAFAAGPWRRLSLAERAGYLRRLAAELQARREQVGRAADRRDGRHPPVHQRRTSTASARSWTG